MLRWQKYIYKCKDKYKYETNTNANTNKSTNQSKWLMGWRRLEQVPRLPSWQLSFCASSPAPTCPTAPLSTLPIHSMPCSTIWALPSLLGPLGQESIWSSWATYHHASIGRPPAHHGDTTCLYCSALVAQNCHFCSAAQMQNCPLGRILNCLTETS